MNTRKLNFLAVALCITASSSIATAQGTTSPPAQPPPAQPAPATPPAPPPQGPPGAPPGSCYPLCRPGFLCHQGQCITACNPPCAAGQTCAEGGSCVAAPAPPPPSYSDAPAYPQAPLYPNPEAEPPRFDRGAERHDGFMLRLALGFGGAGTTIDPDLAGELKMSGASVSFSIDLGGSIVENLVLHGRLASFAIFNPTLEIDGREIGRNEELTATANLVGVGVTYYIMPINLYVTGAVGLSWLGLRYEAGDTDDETSTDAGIGVNLDIGKEFWVSSDWGLGVAARGWWSAIKDTEASVETDVGFLGVAVMFSATYQ